MVIDRWRGIAAPFVALFVACGGTASDAAPEKAAEAPKDAPVVGTVKLREGNCMPPATPEGCRVRGIAARVDAYRAIHLEGPSSSYRFVVPPNTCPVATTTSDAEGRFNLVLPEGRYTIITLHEGRWYPQLYRSGDGEWAGVEVNAAWLEDVELEIDLAVE